MPTRTQVWATVAILVAILVADSTGCQTRPAVHEPDPTLARMLEQRRFDPFEPTNLFPDGRTMRRPPAGTVPTSRVTGPALVTKGIEAGAYATRVPIPVERALLRRGQERFDIFCAPCHGVLGDAKTAVAESMQLRRPPSLQDERIRAYPPGRIFEVITGGYGLMPPYVFQLSVDERWAVVAYVQALQLSQHARVALLPPDVRDELARIAP